MKKVRKGVAPVWKYIAVVFIALAVGFLQYRFGLLALMFELQGAGFLGAIKWITISLVVFGIIVSYLIYGRGRYVLRPRQVASLVIVGGLISVVAGIIMGYGGVAVWIYQNRMLVLQQAAVFGAGVLVGWQHRLVIALLKRVERLLLRTIPRV